MQQLNQEDPRYRIVESQAHEMVSHRFDMIPHALFEKLAEHNQNDLPLELVGSSGRECPCCTESIDEGHIDYDNMHKWLCESCECTNDTELLQYEECPFRGPQFGSWPAAHGILFWTTEWPNTIVDAAVQAGFLVYEPRDFDGHVLAIDGGGYDFYEAHWVPLYLALGLKWHERHENWADLPSNQEGTP